MKFNRHTKYKNHVLFAFISLFLSINAPSECMASSWLGKLNRHNYDPDSTRLKILREQFKNRTYTGEPTTLLFEILEWEKKHGSLEGLGHINNDIGVYYQSIEQYSIALKYLMEGYKLFHEAGSIQGQAYSLSDIANTFYAQGFYEMASQEYRKQLKMFVQAKDTHGTALAMNNIGLTFQSMKQPDSALMWFEKALRIRRTMNDPYLIAHSKIYIGQVYASLKDYTKAEEVTQEALFVMHNKKVRDRFDSVLMGTALYNLGVTAERSGSYEAATRSFEAAFNQYNKCKHQMGMLYTSLHLAEFLHKTHDYEKAEKYMNISLSLSRQSKLIEEYYESVKLKCQWLINDTKSDSLEYYNNELSAATDTLINSFISNRTQEVKSALDAMQLEYQTAKTIEKASNRLRIFIVISISAIVALILIYLLYWYEKRSEHRFRELSDSTFEGIIIHHNGRILMANKAFRNLLGISEAELETKQIADCFPEEDIVRMSLVFSEKAEGEFQTNLICTGDPIQVEILNRPMQYKGRIVNITAIRDITRLKKILYENILLRTAVEQNAVVVVMTDASGIITYVNQKFTQITGYTSEEAIGQKPAILKSGRHNETFYKNLWRTISGGEPWKGEFLNRRKNGELYWENALITPVKNNLNQITQYIAVKEDITLQKQTETELQRRKNMYRELVRQLPQTAVLLYDRSKKYILIEGPLVSEMGIQPMALEGKYFGILVQSMEDEKTISDMINKSFEGQHPMAEMFINNRLCQIQAVPVIEPNQEITLGMLVIRDISEERESQRMLIDSEAQLRNLNATKDKFFSILAHDLKNPFNIILGYADILSHDYDELTDTIKKEYIGQIEIGAQSAFRLLNNLLEWARSQTGSLQFDPQPIDISIPINNSLQVIEPQAQAKGIKFETDLSNNYWVFADLNMVRTVIRNLLTNAIKFSYPGSTVRLTLEELKPGHPDLPTEATENYLKVTVEDHGIGIGSSDLAKLFKTGEKVKTDGTANEVGTGLGLILCHEFIIRNNGRIWATSRQGEGSRFMFILPTTQVNN